MIGGRCKGSNVFSLTVLMVEGLTCFRVDIRQKEKSTVVPFAVDFLFYEVLLLVSLRALNKGEAI